MTTANVNDLLERLKVNDARKAADTAHRYGKLVVRVARGEEGTADNILTALTALGREPAAFATDVTRTVERIELRKLADQLDTRSAAAREAENRLLGIQAEYARECEKLREAYAAREGAAAVAVDTATAAEREATNARAELARTCRDAELLSRLEQIGQEQRQLRNAADVIREEHAHLDRCISEAANARVPFPGGSSRHPADAEKADRDVKRARDIVSTAPERMSRIDAQAAALAAEAAELEARKIEPWPVGVPARG